LRLAGVLAHLKPESQQFLHLDALRFIAAYSVLLLHYRDVLQLGHGAIWRMLGVGSLFVDLFFIISGFIICHGYAHRMSSASDYRRFLQKRVARLAPLHWATLAFYVAIGLAVAALGIKATDPGVFDWSCLPANIAFLHAAGLCEGLTFNSVSWSISAEMLLYLGFPLALLIYRRGAAVALAVGVLAALSLTLAAPHFSDTQWFHWSYDYGVIRAVPSFLIGMGLYGVRGSVPAAPSWFVWLLVALLFALSAAGSPELAQVACVYAIAVAGIAADRAKRSSRAVTFLASGGRLTYSIYMLHTVLFTLVVSTRGKYLCRRMQEGVRPWRSHAPC
jgi:peptidoglycan/LPS O-acetylase OafA/YrhL